MLRMYTDHLLRKQTELSGTWKMEQFSDKEELLGTYTAVVPSCWQSTRGLEDFRGHCKYTKKIYTGGGNIRLVFKGVSHTADVWLDGKYIAHHYTAYTPFDTVVKNVAPGEHTLEVMADNRMTDYATLNFPNDYYSYGGITRPVILEELGNAYIHSLHITPEKTENGWKATFRLQVKNISGAANLKATVELLGKTLSFGIPENGDVTQTAEFTDVQVWSPENPALYIAKATLFEGETPADDLYERFGFREIKVVGDKIMLNGKPLFIKGFNRHEDFGGIGCAVPESIMNMDIDIILSTGANLIRTSHYPNDERFLDLCDERGVLVWEESHARQLYLPRMQLPHYRKQSADCIYEMITNHYNHPSIIMWGILNECETYSDFAVECYRKQIAQIKSLDRSRPTTQATNKYCKDQTHDQPDILSFNLYNGWYYDDDPKEFLAKIKAYADENGGAGKPYIVSEFGAAAIYGYRSFAEVKYSEERQAKILCNLIDAFSSVDYVSGLIVWLYADSRVDSDFSAWNSRPKAQNNKGVVDTYRQPKMAYYAVRDAFTKLPTYQLEEKANG